MRRSAKVKAVLALGVVSGGLWAGTFATFTDTQAATSTFSTGTVNLTLNGDTTSSYTWATLSLSNMKPTDEVYAPLTIANAGTLGYTYTMSSSATNTDGLAVRDELQVAAKLVANAGACDAAGYTASGTTVIAAGDLSAAAIGSARGLAASSSEVLCFYLSLPTGVGNAFQGAATTSTMTFTATQS